MKTSSKMEKQFAADCAAQGLDPADFNQRTSTMTRAVVRFLDVPKASGKYVEATKFRDRWLWTRFNVGSDAGMTVDNPLYVRFTPGVV